MHKKYENKLDCFKEFTTSRFAPWLGSPMLSTFRSHRRSSAMNPQAVGPEVHADRQVGPLEGGCPLRASKVGPELAQAVAWRRQGQLRIDTRTPPFGRDPVERDLAPPFPSAAGVPTEPLRLLVLVHRHPGNGGIGQLPLAPGGALLLVLVVEVRVHLRVWCMRGRDAPVGPGPVT